MAYFLDLFSPETYARFSASDRTVTGFRERHRRMADRVSPGDVLICYLTGVSRWVGLMRVESKPFDDKKPIFMEENDLFHLRFRVKTEVWLAPELAVPIHDKDVWRRLSITREHSPDHATWTGFFRTSLNRFEDTDGEFLEEYLRKQAAKPRPFELSPGDLRALRLRQVRRPGGPVAVTVPDDAPAEEGAADVSPRESIRVQAELARLGASMGFQIWLPANDRVAVLKEWTEAKPGEVLEELPLNYDETTIDTIERIDVLWIRKRSIVRAFEVEHTTAIYSGILRMADLLSLQPNMDIRLHIVAPEVRKQKVFSEIRRPVFQLLDRKPLAEVCSFISYDALRELAKLPHVHHLSDSVLDEYEEWAE